MKLKLLIALFIILEIHFLKAQNPQEILQKSYAKCQRIQNGYYEMTHYFKFMNAKDTSKNKFKCNFKKLENDSFSLPAFRYENTEIAFYTGKELVTVHPWDSTATILSNELWAEKILWESVRFNLFSPLTNAKYPVIQHDSDFINKKYVFSFIGEELLQNENCFHVRVNDIHKDEVSEEIRTIGIEYNYWIKKFDSIPIQYSIAYTNVLKADTMYQYEKNTLDKYSINNLSDENIFTLKSIPAYYKVSDYVPSEVLERLQNNTTAPGWELLSLNDKKVNLNDFKGQLVLIDFFTKACYPCLLSLPGLEALHEKYKKKGLNIIGINIYDKKESGIIPFIKKNGVTYPVLLGGNETGIKYNVSGIPTIYLINKNGKIIFSETGYEKGQEEILEKIIKLNL